MKSPGSDESAEEQGGDAAERPPNGDDDIAGTLVLEHAYRIERRLESGPFYVTWSARQTPFERLVHIRFYKGLDGLGLSAEARERLRGHLEQGGDGELAVDVGELANGAPFLVLEPPRGVSLESWWQSRGGGSANLRAVIAGLLELFEGLTPAQRREVGLERLTVDGVESDGLRLRLYSLGDHPTRAQVRAMSGLVTAGLARGFPPECFLLGDDDGEDLDSTEAADVWRLGAVVHGLLTGRHPLFIDGADVAEVTATLVGGRADASTMPLTGDEALDELLATTLAVTAQERPSLESLRAGLAAAVVDVESPPSGPSPEEDRREQDSGAATVAEPVAPALPRAFRLIVTILAMVVVAIATYLLSNRPPTQAAVVITSDPPGVRFQRVADDGLARDLGRTPIFIASEPIGASLAIQPIYEDGEVGEIRHLSPERLELFEACRRLHVEFQE